MKKKVIIIGSGIAGLALSVRLKSKGYNVEVFEKNENVGGKLSDFISTTLGMILDQNYLQCRILLKIYLKMQK